MITAGISIITKKYVKLATILLAIMLLIFILTIHIPHMIHAASEPDRMISLITLLKDISLMGGSLMIAGMYSETT